jgi:hypothetical protein
VLYCRRKIFWRLNSQLCRIWSSAQSLVPFSWFPCQNQKLWRKASKGHPGYELHSEISQSPVNHAALFTQTGCFWVHDMMKLYQHLTSYPRLKETSKSQVTIIVLFFTSTYRTKFLIFWLSLCFTLWIRNFMKQCFWPSWPAKFVIDIYCKNVWCWVTVTVFSFGLPLLFFFFCLLLSFLLTF